MLDALKRRGSPSAGKEPQDPVLDAVRREKAELAALLDRVEAKSSQLEQAAKAAAAAAEADTQK
jgi:hypothetical protein